MRENGIHFFREIVGLAGIQPESGPASRRVEYQSFLAVFNDLNRNFVSADFDERRLAVNEQGRNFLNFLDHKRHGDGAVFNIGGDIAFLIIKINKSSQRFRKYGSIFSFGIYNDITAFGEHIVNSREKAVVNPFQVVDFGFSVGRNLKSRIGQDSYR